MIQQFLIVAGTIIGTAYLSWSPHAFAEGEDVPHFKYPGRFVLEFPYNTILHDEQYRARMVVENLGSEPLAVIRNGWNDVLQIAWIPWGKEGLVVSAGRTHAGAYKVSPIETLKEGNLSVMPTQVLNLGERYEYDGVLVSIGEKNIVRGGKHEFQPVFFGGKGKLIYADPVEINVLPNGVKDFEKVFDTKNWPEGRGSPLHFQVYEVPIDGETYLFNSTGIRFCRVPPGVRYSIKMDFPEGEYVMTVTFDDPTLDPLVYSWRQYQFVSGSDETVPWLFSKKQAETVDGADKGEDELPVEEASAPVQDGESEQVVVGNEPASGIQHRAVDTGGNHWTAIVVVGFGISSLVILLIWKSKRNRGN